MLTKPLGTHYAVKAHRWLSNDDKREELLNVLSRPAVEGVYKKAAISMASLNINGNKGLERGVISNPPLVWVLQETANSMASLNINGNKGLERGVIGNPSTGLGFYKKASVSKASLNIDGN